MARTLADRLIAKLPDRLPGREFRVDRGATTTVTFDGVHPEVPGVVVHDDGWELTVEVLDFTHGHFSPFEPSQSIETYGDALAEQVIGFLEELFADRIELWCKDRSGGWHRRGCPSANPA